MSKEGYAIKRSYGLMYTHQIPSRKLSGAVLTLALAVILFLTILIAGCGTSSSATAGSPTSTATPTSCISTASGTLQSFNATTLFITNLQGKQVQATYTTKTLFARQATETKAALQEGGRVTVRVTQNADNSYSALQIMVTNGNIAGNTPFGRSRSQAGAGGVRPCSTNRRFNGTPGARAGQGAGAGQGTGTSAQSRQTINGTLGQLNGNTLVVTDASGADYTIGLTSTTRIIGESVISAADLRNGESVTVVGSSNSQGVISASSVLIGLNLSNRSINNGQ
jgi:uncharacterized lipoprotein YehR (DUF1307 family)